MTILFEIEQTSQITTYLNISVVDPQKKEFFWKKSFTGSHTIGIKHSDSFSFIPEASGIHHIRISCVHFPAEIKIGSVKHYLKINDAGFQAVVKIVSGMKTPTQQPFFSPTFVASFIVMYPGIFYLF